MQENHLTVQEIDKEDLRKYNEDLRKDKEDLRKDKEDLRKTKEMKECIENTIKWASLTFKWSSFNFGLCNSQRLVDGTTYLTDTIEVCSTVLP